METSEGARQDLERHFLPVLRPELAVLHLTLGVVAEAAVYQQYG